MRASFALLFALLTVEAQPFRVAGTVIDSESGKALNRALIRLSDDVKEWSTVTSEDGRFSFDVPQGKYRLAATYRDWKDVYGEPIPGSDRGLMVAVRPGSDTAQLEFRFRRAVAIVGNIIDESGEAVPSATVELFQQTVVDGRKRLKSLERAWSSDYGEYTYSWLPAGTYYLAAVGAPWYLDTVSFTEDRSQASRFAPYGVVYFPGTSDPSRATPVVLKPGAEFRADFVLRPSSGARILPTVTLPRPTGDLIRINGQFTLRLAGPGNAETFISDCQANCDRGIASVPAGRYVLDFDGEQGKARVAFDVRGGDLPIEVVPKPGPVVGGQVSFRRPADRTQQPLYVNFVDETSGKTETVRVNADGTFSWPKAYAARFHVHLSGVDGWFIERMSVEGTAAGDGVVELAYGLNVRVVPAKLTRVSC